MARKRNYKAEYRRRMARGRTLGLSKSQARGHPRKGEPLASSDAAKPKSDERIEAAILEMNRGASMSAAARDARVSPKRLKRFILAHRIGSFRKGRWRLHDRRPRQVPIIKDSRSTPIRVPGFASASKVGLYFNAVGQAVNSGDFAKLDAFEGRGVTGVDGRFHLFETDPNALLIYAMLDEPAFHEIYQIQTQ